MRVMVVVTHLLGVGHLTRAAALARAFVGAGDEVMLVSGGRHAPHVALDGVRLVQLPAVHVKGTDFRTLYRDDGALADDEHMATRRMQLVAAFDEFAPDALIIELFPFGRRQLLAEMTALLDAVRRSAGPVAVFSSIRDVLNPVTEQKKVDRSIQQLGHWFDGALVHGDQAIVSLEASFPVSPALARRLHYTGYVRDGQKSAVADVHATGEIIVSGGGSAASLPLMRAALDAAHGDGRNWRLLIGHGVPEAEFAALAAQAPSNAVVERARPDFPTLLRGAACSVSLFGYNTALDIADADVPAVVVPFDAGNEQEQMIRARRFAALGRVEIVETGALDGDVLRAAVDCAIDGHRRGSFTLACDGAARSVEIIAAAVEEKRAETASFARLDQALSDAADAGQAVRFWLRDDDAVEPTAALDRLIALAESFEVPLALAVIPERVTSGLALRLKTHSSVSVLVHGVAHRNNAAAEQKKQELVAADASTLAGLATARARFAAMFGPQALPVLVPPWNRIAPDLIGALPGLGFAGWSGFADQVENRAGDARPTHLDPIAWKAGGGLLPVAPFIDRLTRLVAEQGASGESAEPIGLLTHHLVHDEWLWLFAERLLKTLRAHRNVQFLAAATVFDLT